MDRADRTGDADDAIDWIRGVAPELVDDALRLRQVFALLDRYHREKWQRHVSAGDGIMDRWERAELLGFGEGSTVYDTALVIGDVSVGHHTWIGPNTVLDGSGGLTIGDWCSISSGVQIYSHDSVMRALTGGDAPLETSPTAVGSNTYVGPNTVIGKGVSVGARSIVGAGSLVLDDVPDGSVVYGAPARITGQSSDYIERNTGGLGAVPTE